MHRMLPLAVAILAIPALAAAGAAAEDWTPPTVVTLKGVDKCCNYSQAYLTWHTEAREGRPLAMLVRDGDLLAFDGNGILPYRADDDTELELEVDKTRVVLGGRVVSLELGKDGKGWDWLAKATARDIAELRFVSIELADAAHMPLVMHLAATNPTVGLALPEGSGMAEALPLFKPRWLACKLGDLAEVGAQADPALSRVEFLALIEDGRRGEGGDEPLPIECLARLPRLRQLVMFDWRGGKKAKPIERFPEGCRRLRSLFLGSPLKDLSPIAHLTELRELRLFPGEDLEDIAAVAGLKELRAFSAFAPKITDLSALKGHRDLRWLGIPPGTSQEQFAAAIAQHPRLEVVELIECEGIEDLEPLVGLKQLRGLVLIKSKASLEPLHEMTSLRFLALDKEVFEERPDEVARLDKALPECRIVEGEGICLGSGWVLVLVPVVPVAWLLGRGRRAARRA